MTPARHGEAGVTLIEVLVSLAIFAVIGIAGLTVLDTVARTGARTDGRVERLAQIDRAFLVVRRDLAQIGPSDTRLAEGALTFRRLAGDRAFQVTYRIDDTALLRDIGQGSAAPMAQRMLTGVAAMRWRLLDARGDWIEDWPPAGTAARPRAAELTLDLWRDGLDAPQTVTRVFPLPAGQGR